MELNFIRIALYKLNYVNGLDEIELDENFLDQYWSEYDPEERKNIFDQLAWAVENPGYDFKSLVTSDRFTNEEIYQYIQNLHGFLMKFDAAET